MTLLEKIAEYYTFFIFTISVIGFLVQKDEINVSVLIGRAIVLIGFVAWFAVFYFRGLPA